MRTLYIAGLRVFGRALTTTPVFGPSPPRLSVSLICLPHSLAPASPPAAACWPQDANHIGRPAQDERAYLQGHFTTAAAGGLRQACRGACPGSCRRSGIVAAHDAGRNKKRPGHRARASDRKSTRLNSSHITI